MYCKRTCVPESKATMAYQCPACLHGFHATLCGQKVLQNYGSWMKYLIPGKNTKKNETSPHKSMSMMKERVARHIHTVAWRSDQGIAVRANNSPYIIGNMSQSITRYILPII